MNFNPLFCTETGYTTQGRKNLNSSISSNQILLVQGLCILSKFMIYLEDDLPGSLSIARISIESYLPNRKF